MSQRGFLLDELHFAHKNLTVEEIWIITHRFDFDLFENVSFNEGLHFLKKNCDVLLIFILF